jgi:hypothetical protein
MVMLLIFTRKLFKMENLLLMLPKSKLIFLRWDHLKNLFIPFYKEMIEKLKFGEISKN